MPTGTASRGVAPYRSELRSAVVAEAAFLRKYAEAYRAGNSS